QSQWHTTMLFGECTENFASRCDGADCSASADRADDAKFSEGDTNRSCPPARNPPSLFSYIFNASYGCTERCCALAIR
ncbi:MAG: hypothetical protein Q8K78_12810, partial [Planctomycetaceae bacterium]|nr:hypothetical protein [Planctomycetaceae bacterium]